jgi:hypothetical protein
MFISWLTLESTFFKNAKVGYWIWIYLFITFEVGMGFDFINNKWLYALLYYFLHWLQHFFV